MNSKLKLLVLISLLVVTGHSFAQKTTLQASVSGLKGDGHKATLSVVDGNRFCLSTLWPSTIRAT